MNENTTGQGPQQRTVRPMLTPRANRKPEPSAKAWLLRALMGPAQIIDGVLSTVTVGTVSIGAALEVSRRLAQARIAAIRGDV